jgi:colicin import membrane protein
MNLFKFFLQSITAVVLTALLAACASKPPAVDTNVKIDFPPEDIITSVDQADAALKVAALARSQIDWRYRQKEQICYDKFFMNSCLLDARNEKRVDLARVKKVEVAANFFKRKQQVEDMDRNLVEKNVASPLPAPNPGPSQQMETDQNNGDIAPTQAK